MYKYISFIACIENRVNFLTFFSQEKKRVKLYTYIYYVWQKPNSIILMNLFLFIKIKIILVLIL